MSLKNICLRFIVPFIMMLLGGVLYAPKAEATCTALGCNCVVAATPVSFGAYDAQSLTPLDGVGNVLVTCTALLLGGEVSYEIQINEGGGWQLFPPPIIKRGKHA